MSLFNSMGQHAVRHTHETVQAPGVRYEGMRCTAAAVVVVVPELRYTRRSPTREPRLVTPPSASIAPPPPSSYRLVNSADMSTTIPRVEFWSLVPRVGSRVEFWSLVRNNLLDLGLKSGRPGTSTSGYHTP